MSSKTRNLFKAGKGARKVAISKFKAHSDHKVMENIAATAIVIAAIGIFCIARAIRKKKARENWIAEKNRIKNAHKMTGDLVDGEAVGI